MGLDQYLHKISKDDFERLVAFKRLEEEYNKRVDELYRSKYKDRFESIYGMDCGVIPDDELSKEKLKKLDVIRAEYRKDMGVIKNELGLTLDEDGDVSSEDISNGEEIAYWRKDWDLQNFIIENIWGDIDNDNCVDIPLDENAITRILKWAEDGGDDSEYTDYTISSFCEALEFVKNGWVVYYHPWY